MVAFICVYYSMQQRSITIYQNLKSLNSWQILSIATSKHIYIYISRFSSLYIHLPFRIHVKSIHVSFHTTVGVKLDIIHFGTLISPPLFSSPYKYIEYNSVEKLSCWDVDSPLPVHITVHTARKLAYLIKAIKYIHVEYITVQ